MDGIDPIDFVIIGGTLIVCIAGIASGIVKSRQSKIWIARALPRLRRAGFQVRFFDADQLPQAERKLFDRRTHPETPDLPAPLLYKAMTFRDYQRIVFYHVAGHYIKNENGSFRSPAAETYFCVRVNSGSLRLRISTYDTYLGDPFYNSHLQSISPESVPDLPVNFSVKTNQIPFIKRILELICKINASIELRYILYLVDGRLCISRREPKAFYQFGIFLKIHEAYGELWNAIGKDQRV